MKNYKVVVNGVEYEIGIEEIDVATAKAATSAQAAPAAEAPKAAPSGEGEKVSSPMPGTVLSVSAPAGVSVKRGDVLLILEAMKMENEIMAPCDGKVTFAVDKGTSVNTGDTLCIIR